MWAVLIGLAVVLPLAMRARRARSVERKSGAVTGRRTRRGPLLTAAVLVCGQALLGAPATAQPFDCTQPPNPERPGVGMVGALDPAPMGVGQAGSAYDEYAYAGQVWHTYDLGCGPQGVSNPNAMVDTWIGNQLFNVAKNLVGATNGLHYALLSGDLMAPLDEVISTGTVALYDSVFTPWFGVVAVILAVVLFRYIWQGDLATIGKRTMWALAALWFASATYLTPLVYTHALDDVVITGTSAVQGGFLREVGVDERDALPTLLHHEVVYRSWLRGEFGSPDSPKAQELGRELLDAQAWSKRAVASGEADSPEEKKRAFEEVAAKMGSAYGYFQGVDGSRIGAGMLAMLQGFSYSTFQLLAKAAILLAQVLLRVLILAGPLIGLVALLYHEVLRSVGRIAGAAMLNVVLISAMAGLHTLVLNWIFDPTRGFSLLTRMLLAALLTIIFLMIGKPLRRMGQMVELSVGAAGGAMPRVPPSVFARGRGSRADSGPQDDFWEQVRVSGSSDEPGSAGRHGSVRPESESPAMAATAERMDRQEQQQGEGWSPPQLEGGRGAGAPAGADGGDPPTVEAQRPGTQRGSRALPSSAGASRTVDTAPITEAVWNNREEDPVLVPSRVDDPTPAELPRVDSGRRDSEVVSGRQVHVVYRPSRGLEVADE